MKTKSEKNLPARAVSEVLLEAVTGEEKNQPISEKKPKIGLADFLKEKRQSRGLNMEKLSELTKIQIYHLKSMEEGNFENLPPAVYREGIFKRLAKFLDTDEKEIMEMYRNENGGTNNPDYVNNVIEPKRHFSFTLTPKKVTLFLGCLLLAGLSVYLWYQLNFLVGPPALAIEPKEDVAIKDEAVSVKGKTDIGTDLKINGENVYVESNGNFTKDIQLAAGLNIIEIVAVNRYGKSTKIIRQIFKESQNN